jgi:hypothetical protein
MTTFMIFSLSKDAKTRHGDELGLCVKDDVQHGGLSLVPTSALDSP